MAEGVAFGALDNDFVFDLMLDDVEDVTVHDDGSVGEQGIPGFGGDKVEDKVNDVATGTVVLSRKEARSLGGDGGGVDRVGCSDEVNNLLWGEGSGAVDAFEEEAVLDEDCVDGGGGVNHEGSGQEEVVEDCSSIGFEIVEGGAFGRCEDDIPLGVPGEGSNLGGIEEGHSRSSKGLDSCSA